MQGACGSGSGISYIHARDGSVMGYIKRYSESLHVSEAIFRDWPRWKQWRHIDDLKARRQKLIDGKTTTGFLASDKKLTFKMLREIQWLSRIVRQQYDLTWSEYCALYQRDKKHRQTRLSEYVPGGQMSNVWWVKQTPSKD